MLQTPSPGPKKPEASPLTKDKDDAGKNYTVSVVIELISYCTFSLRCDKYLWKTNQTRLIA